MVVPSCNHCQNVVLSPISKEDSEKLQTSSASHSIDTFEISEDEIRTGAQAGCAFFQLCIKKLNAYRDLAFSSAPRHLIGRIPPGYDVKDLHLSWELGAVGDKRWRATDSADFTLGIVSEEGHHDAPCPEVSFSDHTERNNAANFVSSRIAYQDIACESAFKTYRSWLRTCDREHDSCRYAGEDWAPPKLIAIDWDSQDEAPRLRLIHGSSLASATREYVAVSYCWGEKSHMDAIITDLTKDKVNISFQKLPRTLKDAITIVHKLCFKYIWIDSLCIAQDDPHEMALGISNMRRTYEQAALVVSAARAKSSEQGILHDIQIPEAEAEQYRMLYACPDGTQGSVIAYEYPNEERLRSDPIEYRAWCLQEHLLAPRIIRLGNLTVSYICREYFRRYGHGQNSPRGASDDINMHIQHNSFFKMMHSSEFDEERTQLLWEHLLKKYTSRKLSVATDRLPALAGIAELFHNIRPNDYLAGLWRKDLPIDLMWQCDVEVALRTPGQPSWSWCSLEGIVSHNQHRSHSADPELEVLDCHPLLKYRNAPFAEVSGGILTVKGKIRPVRLSADVFRQPLVVVDRLGRPNPNALRMSWHRDISKEKDVDLAGGLAWCLEVCHFDDETETGPCGLVLIHVPSQAAYQRIGIFVPWDISESSPTVRDGQLAEWMSGYELRTITII